MYHLIGIYSQFLHLWELPTSSVLHTAQSVLGHGVSFHSIPQLQSHSVGNHTSAASNSNRGKIQQTAGWKEKSHFLKNLGNLCFKIQLALPPCCDYTVLNKHNFPEYSGIPYETHGAGTGRQRSWHHIVGLDDQSEQKFGFFFFL